MKLLIAIIFIAGISGLFLTLFRKGVTSGSLASPKLAAPRESSAIPEQVPPESLVTFKQIPPVVAKLQNDKKEGSFAVFMFDPPGEPGGSAVNLQYSIERGVVGLDWVLLSPRNIADKEALSAFITNSGQTVSEHEMNDVKYLRVEGIGLHELGVKICRDFYHLSPNEKIDLLADGFEWQP